MQAAIPVFPGTWSDRDCEWALQQVGIQSRRVWHRDPASFERDELVVLPGGFSYGDYLRCGAIARFSPVMDAVRDHAAAGGLVIGICNGFQILCEAGLLPGVLMTNASLSFICRDVDLRVENAGSAFTSRYATGQVVRMPIAHHGGNYFTDDDTLARIEGGGQVAFRYCAPDGTLREDANPNGSCNAIAGIFNEARTVLGMMPHPERLADPALGGTDGRAMFDGLVEALS